MKRESRFHASLGTDGVLELVIYGDIVDAVTAGYLESWGYDPSTFVTALSVKKALDTAGAYSKIRLRINSGGGDAFEGMAIHSLLTGQNKPVEAYVDGIAASAASVIAMSADTRIMGRSAMIMIHNAWGSCLGFATDMRKTADILDTISASIASVYVDRTGMSEKDVLKLMDAETWLSAQDCVDQQFATGVVSPPAAEEARAMAKARRFAAMAKLRNAPDKFKAAGACACECQACMDGDCSACTNEDCTDKNCEDCPMQNSAAANQAPSLPVEDHSAAPAAAAAPPVEDHSAREEMEFARARQRVRAKRLAV